MRATWITSDNIISALGATTEENYRVLRNGKSGIARVQYDGINEELALGKINDLPAEERYASLTRFEKLAVQSAEGALKNSAFDPASDRAIFILSSTKGNIELLEQGQGDDKRIHLHETAKTIARFFGNTITPVVVSSACISGVMAMLTAKYLLESNQYDHAIVIGADVLSRFVISGFQSLQAMSAETCKPFDKKRKGVNLGEAASTIVLTSDPAAIIAKKKIQVIGGGLSNDANHISGPSRTGEELNAAIQQALREAGINKADIDFISAHGTATVYNDEMEAKAFHLAGMNGVPLNSLKGYFGHTLGAAGILESVISIHALQNNELIPSFGFEESGVSQPVNVIEKLEAKNINICLKTASGFGGCNAAIIFKKEL